MKQLLAFSLNGLVGVAIASAAAHFFDLGTGGLVAISTIAWWIAGVHAIEKAGGRGDGTSGHVSENGSR